MRIAQQCPLVNTPLFADDLAILPKNAKEFRTWWFSPANRSERENIIARFQSTIRSFRTSKKPDLLYYRDISVASHMQKALSLFSDWLEMTGMEANSAKSKIVVFTAATKNSRTWSNQLSNQTHWFQNLRLDGFNLELTSSYEYLCVTLDEQLSFSQHIQKLTFRASKISNLICRLFYQKQSMPHPLAAIKIVRSLLLPTITYAIELWFNHLPSQSKSKDVIDSLHSLIIKPITIAADLPHTTHRLGMFVDFGIPTLHDLAAQSTMRYYQKYSSPQIHNQSIIQQIVASNTLYSGIPIDTIHPSITRMLQDAHFDSNIIPNTLIQQHKWTTVGARARFIISPAIDNQMNQLK